MVNIAFPDEIDANTITGLFMIRLNRLPCSGDVFEQSGLRFVAIDVYNNRVGNVQINPLNALLTTNSMNADTDNNKSDGENNILTVNEKDQAEIEK